jgi:hypothetical protein
MVNRKACPLYAIRFTQSRQNISSTHTETTLSERKRCSCIGFPSPLHCSYVYACAFSSYLTSNGVTPQCRWLRRYATSQNVAGLIPGEVTKFFRLPSRSSRSMTLGLEQPLTKDPIANFKSCMSDIFIVIGPIFKYFHRKC